MYYSLLAELASFVTRCIGDPKKNPRYLPSWSLTASLPLKSYRNPKGKDRLPTIVFQGRTVKLRRCNSSIAIYLVRGPLGFGRDFVGTDGFPSESESELHLQLVYRGPPSMLYSFHVFLKSYLNHIWQSSIRLEHQSIHQSSWMFRASRFDVSFRISFHIGSQQALLLAQFWSTSTALWAGLAQSGGEATRHQVCQGLPQVPILGMGDLSPLMTESL